MTPLAEMHGVSGLPGPISKPRVLGGLAVEARPATAGAQMLLCEEYRAVVARMR